MDGRKAARRIRALRFISHLSIACAIPLICAGIWLKIFNSNARVQVKLPITELQSALSQVQTAKLQTLVIAEIAPLEIKTSAPKLTRISSQKLAKRAQKVDLSIIELEQEARVAVLAFEGWDEVDLTQDAELDDAQHMRLAYFELKNAFQLALLEPVVESIQIAQAVTTGGSIRDSASHSATPVDLSDSSTEESACKERSKEAPPRSCSHPGS
jgi:hypothetical protein